MYNTYKKYAKLYVLIEKKKHTSGVDQDRKKIGTFDVASRNLVWPFAAPESWVPS